MTQTYEIILDDENNIQAFIHSGTGTLTINNEANEDTISLGKSEVSLLLRFILNYYSISYNTGE